MRRLSPQSPKEYLLLSIPPCLGLIFSLTPLLNILGYESSFFLGLVVGPLGFWCGQTPKASQGIVPPPLRALLMGLLAFLFIMSANTIRVQNCDYIEGLEFFLLLPVVSTLYGYALGLWVRGLPFNDKKKVSAAILIVPVLMDIWGFYHHPPIFIFDHLYGYFAGSIYDEAIGIDTKLLMFRANTGLRILGLFCLTFVSHRCTWPTILGAHLIILALLLPLESHWEPKYGYRFTHDTMAQHFQETYEDDKVQIFFGKGISKIQRKNLTEDHLFRLGQLQQKLELKTLPKIRSYVYASAHKKRFFMGGYHTMFAKPWLQEIHIHGTKVPHSVLAHELVHAVASDFGTSWLGVSAQHEVLINMGVVEGFAEALTPSRNKLTIHQAARSLFQDNRAPKLENLLNSFGFWKVAPRRAYTTVGSFMRYLRTHYPPQWLVKSYQSGDFANHYGKPLSTLADEWKTYLQTIKVDKIESRAAAKQFRTPSILEKPCAHVIASLRSEARRLSPDTALPVYQKICDLLGDTPSSQLDLADALAQANQIDALLKLSSKLIESHFLHEDQLNRIHTLLGKTLWRLGEIETAKQHFTLALLHKTGQDNYRYLTMSLWALSQKKKTQTILRNYLLGQHKNKEVCKTIQALKKKGTTNPELDYLVGRCFFNRRHYVKAIQTFMSMSPMDSDIFEGERIKLLGDAHYHQSKYPEAIGYFTQYRSLAPNAGAVERIDDFIERAKFMDLRKPVQ